MDAETWKSIFSVALAGIGGVVAWVWKKVDNAVSKEDLAKAINAIDKTNDEWRETTKLLFANAESDRRQTNERFGKALDKIHEAEQKTSETQIALMQKIHEASLAANRATTDARIALEKHNK